MRFVAGASRTLLVLAPSKHAVPAHFGHPQADPGRHKNLLDEMQRFRGRLYLEDGAIKPSQLNEGRHCLEIDHESWHLLVLDRTGHICGCMRYREYEVGVRFSELEVSKSAPASSSEWNQSLRGAVEAERNLSKHLGRTISEAGGWALDEEIRGTAEALRIALATFALAQELGDTIGISTVTQRHESASILRRMGGQPLEFRGTQLPAYYDPQYDCQMEILRFYSWALNPRYSIWIDEIKEQLRTAEVVTNGAVGPEWVAAIRSRPQAQELRQTASAVWSGHTCRALLTNPA
ncbi:MAG TPA: hypothetical protein VGN17_20460 [Bryobacteraceae bacterium]|jgi:hypothetical protein